MTGQQLPAAPEWLSDAAADIWDHVAPELPQGSLDTAGQWALAMWCTALAQYQALDVEIQRSGILIAGVDGLIPNPSVSLRDRAADQASRWAAYFQATPKDRRGRERPPETANHPAGYTVRTYPRLVEQ